MPTNNKKIVAIVPIKQKSKRVKNKNFRQIYNIPLYKITLDKVKKCRFDEIYVDTDSKEIKNYCLKNNIKFIKRKPELAKDKANGNDLINYHRKLIDADIYFQILVTSPLLKISSINKCIDIISKSKKHDSIFTTKSIKTFFWYNKKPINYFPKILPRSQDLKPLVIETTSLYGIKKEALDKFECRLGANPYFFEVDDFEMIDLNNKKDFEYLEMLINFDTIKNKEYKKKIKKYLNILI
jgi:CMP-N-acetylneuraminic acid synthetase